jgi:hypothetical protein
VRVVRRAAWEGDWGLGTGGAAERFEDDFYFGRALCVRLPDGPRPVLLEMAARSMPEHVPGHGPRRLHLVRVVGVPRYLADAMAFPGRGVFNRGRWETIASTRVHWS